MNSIDTPMHVWRDVFQVNFFAPIMLARGLFKELAAAKGSIVNVTSIAGTRVHPFAGTAYATSKAALGSLTREMAHDFGPHGIRVNAIAPGEIDTAILSPGTDKIVETIPLRRLGTTAEVADIIFFLCSQPGVLRDRLGNPHQWRPARLRRGQAAFSMASMSVTAWLVRVLGISARTLSLTACAASCACRPAPWAARQERSP